MSMGFSGEETRMATVMTRTASQSNLRSAMPRRRFQLLDAMILVAAIAFACGITQGLSYATDGAISWTAMWEVARQNHDGLAGVVEIGAYSLILALPFAGMLSLAVIPLRLMGSRPRWRRLARQPGITAMWAAGLGIALSAVQIGIAAWTGMGEASIYQIVIATHSCISYPGLAVLGAWALLLISKRWRSEMSWVDRMGRVLGFFWILVGVFVPIVVLLCGGLF
jgi:hypothetical protein